MKSIKQLRETYDLITEKEDTDFRKLTTLVRAGLFDSKKLPLLKRALEKDAGKLTPAERKVLIQLLDSLMSEVLGSQQLYTKVKQNVMTKEEYIEESRRDYYTRFDPRFKKNPKTLPNIIILKRKAMRVYPDNQVVGLYYSQTLDKYISIPFDTGSKGSKHINAVMNEQKKNDDEEDNNTTKKSISYKKRERGEMLRTTPLSKMAHSKRRLSAVRKIALKSAGSSLASGDVHGALGAVGFAAGSLLARRKPSPKPKMNVTKQTSKSTVPSANDNVALKKTVREMFKRKLEEKTEELNEVLPLFALAAKPVAGAIAGAVARRAAQKGAKEIAKKAARSTARNPVGRGPARPAPKTEPVPASPPAKPSTQPAPKTEPAAPPATPAKPAPKPETKPAPAPAKPDPAPKTEPASPPAKPSTQPAPKTEPAPKPETKPAPAPKTEPASQPSTGTQTAPASKPAQGLSRGTAWQRARARLSRAMRRTPGAGAAAPLGGGMNATEPKYAKVDIDPKKAKTSKATGFDPNVARSKQDTTLNRKLLQTNEHNISLLKKNMVNETTSLVLNDGSQVNINRNIAEKIVNLYESLNVKNKKVMLNLLNENHESFKKVLNFTVRQ
jgi:hypothetical protein